MIHKFPYTEFEPVEIPDPNISGFYTLSQNHSNKSDEYVVTEALANPIGSVRLEQLVGPGMKITIAVDDNSRSTKTELMLPLILKQLQKAGARKEDICIFIALGTHRQMTQEEINDKYTPAVVANYRIINHNWKDKSPYVVAGKSQRGFDIRINKEITDADFVVGIGQTIPHLIAGFGGGAKIINPGCCDEETIGQMHWLSHEVPSDRRFAVRDNDVRKLIDEIAVTAGLKFILNEVPGAGDHLAGAFAGDPVKAHKAACKFAKQICTVKLKEKTDIVIADAYPADLDFWQALKGLHAAYGAVKKGGTVILVSPCHEGASLQHPEVTKIGYSIDYARTLELVENGKIDKVIGGNLWLGHELYEKAQTILITKGICRQDTESMGYLWAPGPQEGLKMALEKHGSAAKINILYKSSKMICES